MGNEGTNSGYDKKAEVSKRDIIMITLTLINCSVGPGMMSLPKVVSTVGLLPAYIFFIVSTMYIFFFAKQVTNANYHGNFDTFPDLMKSLWGKKWGMLLDVSLVLCNTGFLVSYVTVSSDYIRSFIEYFGKIPELDSDLWHKLFKVIICVVIFVPLSLLRTIDAISNLTAFSFVFSLVAVVMINVRFFQYIATGVVSGVERPLVGEGENVFDKYFAPMSTRIPALFSYFYTFFILFTIHASLTPMQREFGAKKGKKKDGKESSEPVISTPSQRMKTMTKGFNISTSIVLVIYLIVATEGALMFDRSCKNDDGTEKDNCVAITSNILLNFGDDTAVMIIMLAYAIVVIIGYPCLMYPVRTSVCKWLKVDRWNGKNRNAMKEEVKSEGDKNSKKNKNDTDVEDEKESEKKQQGLEEEEEREKKEKEEKEEQEKKLPFTVRRGYMVYCFIGFVVIIITCVLSIFVPEIDKMISLISNICGVFIFEISGIFIYYKRALLKKYSIGIGIDKAMNEWKIVKSIEEIQVQKHEDEVSTTGDSSIAVLPQKIPAKNSIMIFHPVGSKKETRKRQSSFVAGLKRFRDFRNSSLINTENIKNRYSFYIGDNKKIHGSSSLSRNSDKSISGIIDISGKSKKKLKKDKNSLEMEINGTDDLEGGRRTWSEETSETSVSGEIEMPKIDTDSGKTSSSSSSSDKSSKGNDEPSSSVDTEAEVSDESALSHTDKNGSSISCNSRKSLAKKMRNSMNIVSTDKKRSKSLIIVNEKEEKKRGSSLVQVGQNMEEDPNYIEAVFPDVSHIDIRKFKKHPKGSKVFLLISSIFFVALALTATACDIYGWVAYD